MAAPLSEQVVLITGASSGIGEALALRLAESKTKMVLAARREGVLQTVKDLVIRKGGEVLVVPTDMADPQQVKALASKALDHFGQVDVLVNNAGFGQMGPIEEVNEEAVQRQFDVNVFGLLTLTRALLPHMRQRQQGLIMNISSVAGQISMPFSGIYNASKHAVEAISDALRVEVAPFGIRVVVVEPGPVSTEFFRVAAEKTASVVAQNSPYQEVLERMEGRAQSIDRIAWPVEKVVDVMIKAMMAPHPAPRYAAFGAGKLGLGLIRLLPATWADRMWIRMLDLQEH
jgi:short-subunit dehydrogenase